MIAKPKRRFRQTVKDVGAENDLLNDLGFNLCIAPRFSGHEVGRVFWSSRSRQDRGSKRSSGGVRENKIRLELIDINLQTEELHCNYSVLIGSLE